MFHELRKKLPDGVHLHEGGNILPSLPTTRPSRRVGSHRMRGLGWVALIGASGLWAFAGVAQAQSAPSFTTLPPGAFMLAGSNRYQIAVNAAKAAYPKATTAILASGATSNEMDALLASPLATALKAPILLTQNASTIGKTTAQALTSMHISSVVLVGAVAAQASSLKSGLPSGTTVSAVYGSADPSNTALSVAGALAKAESVKTFKSVFVVSSAPQNLADLVSAAPAAAMTGSPIFVAKPSSKSSIPANEAPYVDSAGTIYAVGAASAVNFANTSATTKLVPLTGATRSDTLLAIDNAFVPQATSVFIANGGNNHLADSLAVAPLIAEQDGALLFMYDANRPTPSGTQTFLSNTAAASLVTTMTLVGGPTAVPTIDYTMLETDFPALGDAVNTFTLTPATKTPTVDSVIGVTAKVVSDAQKPITTPVSWSITGSNSSNAVIESTGADSASLVAVTPGTYVVSATVDGATQTLSLNIGGTTSGATSSGS